MLSMNPGAIEEGGSTARTLISSLATTPMVLALVVFNLLYIAGTTYLQIKQAERFTDSQAMWERIVERAMAYCPGQPPFKLQSDESKPEPEPPRE
jgi:hypothetical protein